MPSMALGQQLQPHQEQALHLHLLPIKAMLKLLDYQDKMQEPRRLNTMPREIVNQQTRLQVQ